VSIAMLTVPETLGPTERAVFVLREVFDTPYEEIAEAIGKSPDAVRQIARRARDHVADRRPRMPVSQAEQQAPERFLLAVRTGHVQQLMEVIAPDVVLIADGGGVVPAARAPIHSAAQVARLLARASRAHTPVTSGVWLNGSPAARVEIGGQMAVVSLVIEAGRLTRIYAMANPDKLTRLDAPAELTRQVAGPRSARPVSRRATVDGRSTSEKNGNRVQTGEGQLLNRGHWRLLEVGLLFAQECDITLESYSRRASPTEASK
jgi:RNA polymerase sigma-70 factor (ECF subfamily)